MCNKALAGRARNLVTSECLRDWKVAMNGKKERPGLRSILTLRRSAIVRYGAPVANNIRIDFYVQPRASRSEVVGQYDGRIKIRLAAPPVDGAANAELVRFVAERLGVAKSKVRVVAGETSRRKVVEVEGVERALVQERLGK
jgi:uncharacterized protein (TIGR00251 family)